MNMYYFIVYVTMIKVYLSPANTEMALSVQSFPRPLFRPSHFTFPRIYRQLLMGLSSTLVGELYATVA